MFVGSTVDLYTSVCIGAVAGIVFGSRPSFYLSPGQTLFDHFRLREWCTGCPKKNASTLKGRHFFRFEYFFKWFVGRKILNIRLSPKWIENSENL